MKFLSLFLSFVIISFPSLSQDRIQSPSEFLGYELGTQFSRHHQVLDYFEYLADQSPMVQLTQYGETYEKRPLIALYISDSENIQNLESIRLDNLKRSGVESGTPGSDKGIIWLGYNVHGNESVSTEASMQTAFELITNRQEWLKDIVVIMDPCINPDGRERYVNFYWQFGQQPYNPDPMALEHREGWLSGRANHYMFDLNRDWAWLSQTESKSRVNLYNKWLPQIAVDFHEQGVNQPYYFAPAAEPYHNQLTPWQKEFQQTIGKNHAKWFDANNWLYFTDEIFDLLYPSYGDTYPSFHGSIGMTYEQGGSGRAGLGVLTDEGDTLTLKDRISHHYSTGLSTVEIGSKHKDRLLTEYEKFFNRKDSRYKAFVLKTGSVMNKSNQLMDWLDELGIDYKTVSSSRSIKGVRYSDQSYRTTTVQNGDVVVSTTQPKSAFIHALFEPEAKLSDSLTYDITAWSVPYAYGIESYAVETPLANLIEYKRDDFRQNVLGERPYAYLCDWNHVKHAEFLSHLIRNKVQVRVSDRSFQFNGKSFNRGSLIITRKGNEELLDKFDELVISGANAREIPIYTTSTGFSQSGVDIGSSSVRAINPPKVALITGESISSLAIGETWYYFEQVLKYPLTLLKSGLANKRNLKNYDVLILQNGSYRSLTDDQLADIKNWVDAGGRLIVVQYAINKLIQNGNFGVMDYNNKEDNGSNAPEPSKSKFGNRERDNIRNMISGAIFRTELDNTHPLGYGYENRYFSLKTNSLRVAPLLSGWNVATINSKSDKLSGFAGSNALRKMENSLLFGTENIGNGSVTYMVDNPLFRAFWKNGHLIFANAVFFNR